MEKKKIMKEEVVEKVDYDTGEITMERNITTFSVEKEPEYVKLYIDDISRLKGIPEAENDVLHQLVANMSYNNIICTIKPLKMMMAQNIKKKDGTPQSLSFIDKACSNLAKHGVIHRVARGVYMVDPELFAKGKWQDIKKLRLMVEYDPSSGKRKLVSNVSDEGQLLLGL